MRQVPSEAAQAIVRDLDGHELELASLWSERPVVLVFLRHFGCLFCREHAVEYHRQRDAIRARGADLVFVGNGNRHFAQGFRDAFGLQDRLLVDTRRDAYRALEMKRGLVRTLLSPSALKHTIRAFRAGFRQGRTRGDAWQLGGVLLVHPGGRVDFSHLSENAGDHAPVADVLAALPG